MLEPSLSLQFSDRKAALSTLMDIFSSFLVCASVTIVIEAVDDSTLRLHSMTFPIP